MRQAILFINSLLIVWFIFFQNKNYRSSLKWILLFLAIPLFSFIIYFFVGMGIKVDRKRYEKINQRIEKLFITDKHNMKCVNEDLKQVLQLNETLGGSDLTFYNDVYYYTDGEEYYSLLLKELNLAKKSIDIEMYIFKNDTFGQTLMTLLLKKAKEGVKIKIVYDPNGCFNHQFNWMKKFKHENIIIVKFYPFFFQIRNFNYRNHRKIIIIDNRISYVGGFNFGNEYISLDDKVSPFRDTQIKIVGEGVKSLKRQFMMDFYYAYSFVKKNFDIDFDIRDFSNNKVNKIIPLQIISTSYLIRENIKRAKMKIISLAKKSIYIQTPYFILDLEMMEILKMQLLSGVEINIMIPLKYDQKIPFSATLSYVKELHNLGANIYLYEGFIHAKTLIVDDYYLIVGSSNFDIRSFSSNLESDAFIYSYNEVERYRNIFNIDRCNSIIFDENIEQRYFSSFKLGKKVVKFISSIL